MIIILFGLSLWSFLVIVLSLIIVRFLLGYGILRSLYVLVRLGVIILVYCIRCFILLYIFFV